MSNDKNQIRVREQIREFIPRGDRATFESLADQYDSLEKKMEKASKRKARDAAYNFAKCSIELFKEERRLLQAALMGVAKVRDQKIKESRAGATVREDLKQQYKDRQMTRAQFFEQIKALPPVDKLKLRSENGDRPTMVQMGQLKLSIRVVSGLADAMLPAEKELVIRKMKSAAGINTSPDLPVKKTLLDAYDEVDNRCRLYAEAYAEKVAG